ncbi:MAG TPA: copper amine oxidase N-terminal domain-containing protein [Bacillales bacterium]|nr:copper amine oxidase N-terminal domain-containing protein [Bacillales bacterium]
MKKIHLLPAAFLLTSSILGYGLVANADDDHKKKDHHKYSDERKYEKLDYKKSRYEDDDDDEKYDYYKKDRYKDRDEYKKYHDDDHDDDDDDDDYEENEYDYFNDQQQINVIKESWFKWSRSVAEPGEIAAMPISQATEILLKMNNEEPIKIEAIPDGSQLLVPVEEVANYLGAKTMVYPKSDIVEINKDSMQLIVRNNTKVVYENMKKTPMQAKLTKKNDEYYMPISVLANGLGFQIMETTTNNQIEVKGGAQL